MTACVSLSQFLGAEGLQEQFLAGTLSQAPRTYKEMLCLLCEKVALQRPLPREPQILPMSPLHPITTPKP